MTTATTPKSVVGRFRSGYQIDDRPAALTEWRITTGDPEVADKVHDLLGGDAPQEWAAKGEDNLEVFTASKSVAIILDGERALRQRMVLWARSGKPIYTSDGRVAGDAPSTRHDGIGPVPDIEVFFRLAEEPDLGIFKFKTGSWSMASDLAYNGTVDAIVDAAADSETGKVKAILELEEVSFVAKNGPRKGQTVNYTKPVLNPVGI